METKLGFGLMRLPVTDVLGESIIDYEVLNKMVDTFLDRGFTYFDTAYMYMMGKSEIALRECLVKRHPRTSFTVATKLPIMLLKTVEDQERIFNEQLEKCGVDYFDYYLLHNLGVSHYEVATRLESFKFIEEKKNAGLIKQIGFSFHDTADLLDQILTEHPEVDFVQLQINYLDWENESIQSRKCYEVARAHQVPIIVMEPVKGGTLANVGEKVEQLFKSYDDKHSIPSWAIRFAASHEGIVKVLSGMSNKEQLLDNTSYMQQFEPLQEKELELVFQAVDLLNEAIVIPCTACDYCTERCPKNIAIPKYFALYNAEMQMAKTNFSIQRVYYHNLIKTYQKASDCIGCKQCERDCPQHIEITTFLKEIVKVFEEN